MATEEATQQTEPVQTAMDGIKGILSHVHERDETPPKEVESAHMRTPDETSPEQEPEVEEEDLGDDIFRAAASIGLSRAEARALGQDAVERLVSQWTREPAPVQEPQQNTPEQFAIELPEEVDESIRTAFQSMQKHYEDRLAKLGELPSRLEALEKFYADAQRAQQEQWADSKFSSLGSEYHDLLGEGQTRGLKQGSRELANRLAVLEEIGVYVAGLQAQGKPLPDPDVLFERAVNSVFGPKQALLARKQVEAKVRDQAGRFLSKPKGKGETNELSGMDRVRQIVSEARAR